MRTFEGNAPGAIRRPRIFRRNVIQRNVSQFPEIHHFTGGGASCHSSADAGCLLAPGIAEGHEDPEPKDIPAAREMPSIGS